MIKNPLPLNPKNYQDRPKEKKPEKFLNALHPEHALLDCEESIEVACVPISAFDIKNSFAGDSDNCPSLVWTVSENDYLTSLSSKELQYMPNPYYIQTMQPHLTCSMRALLYDWMMEVCAELTLKRETFHLSLNLCDRYLSLKSNIKKEEYQLIGLTCMYLSSKLEEIISPSLEDWASSADDGYSKSLIIQTELLLLKTLDFKALPSTPCVWLNWLMTQWDSYINFHFSCVPGNSLKDIEQYADKKRVKIEFEDRMIYFKQANQKAYKRFRETMQLLDLGMLHPGSLRFLPKMLAGGLLYLMVSKYFFESNYALLYFNGDLKSAESRLEDDIDLNDPFRIECISNVQELFQDFIQTAGNINSIDDIYPTVSFFHPFLEFEASFDLPVVCKLKSKANLESHYEDFLSYQTHNSRNLNFIEQSINSLHN